MRPIELVLLHSFSFHQLVVLLESVGVVLVGLAEKGAEQAIVLGLSDPSMFLIHD